MAMSIFSSTYNLWVLCIHDGIRTCIHTEFGPPPAARAIRVWLAAGPGSPPPGTGLRVGNWGPGG
jgi:hypothetical protein